jgi:hypothetical protein
VVVHVDEDGEAEDLAPKQDGGPCMVIRLQPMSGGLCRYSFISTADDEPERTVIPTSEVNERIVTTSESHPGLISGQDISLTLQSTNTASSSSARRRTLRQTRLQPRTDSDRR